jgi:threonine dehydratase
MMVESQNDGPIATIADVLSTLPHVRRLVSETPLIRSHALEKELQLPKSRRVWLKDFGWTPTGSFKILGAIGWMARYADSVGDRPVAASSSGNFASGLACASKEFGKRAIILMPDNAPKIKFELTRSFGAEVRTYDISQDHITGDRERMTLEISQSENAVIASPYDDIGVIAGNGVGGLEIIDALRRENRSLGCLVCPVSGGGLMAGLSLVLREQYPEAKIVAVEPEQANDFQRSLACGTRSTVEHPTSICDGLLSYSVGKHNWPILQRCVTQCDLFSDNEVRKAMKWLYDHHGIRTEPSGAISVAGLLKQGPCQTTDGDLVAVIGGRNVDDDCFIEHLIAA